MIKKTSDTHNMLGFDLADELGILRAVDVCTKGEVVDR